MTVIKFVITDEFFPNNSNYDDFQTEFLTKLTTEESKTDDDVILCADLNIDLQKIESGTSTSIFMTA